ncbi:hypothetical protein LTR78_008402 [Recurvomyces mirabilis]|uniref:Mannan endo-1,6-alpha-mannosidase n=1 Tax=Recurvomyces mirabilis TaxID=574656 RepID=A0AAE0WHP6_9PEZI|nr:hypothetical protein LTR78_008402 [Recurvomyces mirabilis]KAK5155389.1 hypothetical protein LTS14_005650 [Recurvomyces mirabilis]
MSLYQVWLTLTVIVQPCLAIQLDVTSTESLKAASGTVANGMMKYYSGNETGNWPGNLPSPYYWWHAGAMFMTMVDYWYTTGDTTYNTNTIQAMDWQAGEQGIFMPANQTTTEGNDDQVFWAFAAMTAAEFNFPSLEADYPSWLAMAQGVFNEQARRWDSTTCGGGLRWQIFPTNNGYNYKNSVANGGFFQLASRLARYTGNQTYVDWGTKSWEWFEGSVLFDNATYAINDGTDDTANCVLADHTQWSYNYGIYLGGLAYLYNHTKDDRWLPPLQGILNRTLTEFFPASMGNKIAVEVAFWPYLQASAQGVAGQCDGGSDGVTCGMEWNSTKWDGTYGIGQQLSALSVIQANLIQTSRLGAPFTSDTGGTSQGDPNAGSGSDNPGLGSEYTRTIKSADKGGAGFLTLLAVGSTLGGAYFLVT